MPRRFQILIAASFAVAALTIHSPRAWSGEKHRRTICCQPIVTCQPIACQTAGPVPTCCLPAATTISAAALSSPIELCAHTQPAPRRLTPQPDPLEIKPTMDTTYCAIYAWANWGFYESYYAIDCSTNSPLSIDGNLSPLPGDCENPGSACITFGSSFVPTASGARGSKVTGSFSQKGIKLARKHKAGEEPINKANPQATSPRTLKERTRIGQPIFVKFPRLPGSADFVVVELQRFSVKGTGATGQELTGTFAVGMEIDQAPTGKQVKELSRDQLTISDDHVARLEIGNVRYGIVTASKLRP